MKTLFYKVIETIKNEELRNYARFCADNVPEYFWTAQGSSSGKYHPVTDLGEGGLVRHSLMAYRVLMDLLRKDDTCSSEFEDMGIIATLFHDCCKYGTKDTPAQHTEHNHPLLAADFLELHSCYFNLGQAKDIICKAVSTHMGRWNTCSWSDVVLPTPKTLFQNMVHEADYIASRKYCLFDREFFNNF